MSLLMGFYLYGIACILGGFWLGIIWKDGR